LLFAILVSRLGRGFNLGIWQSCWLYRAQAKSNTNRSGRSRKYSVLFSKGVYRQYKLKIAESLTIQPKVGLQRVGWVKRSEPTNMKVDFVVNSVERFGARDSALIYPTRLICTHSAIIG